MVLVYFSPSFIYLLDCDRMWIYHHPPGVLGQVQELQQRGHLLVDDVPGESLESAEVCEGLLDGELEVEADVLGVIIIILTIIMRIITWGMKPTRPPGSPMLRSPGTPPNTLMSPAFTRDSIFCKQKIRNY